MKYGGVVVIFLASPVLLMPGQPFGLDDRTRWRWEVRWLHHPPAPQVETAVVVRRAAVPARLRVVAGPAVLECALGFGRGQHVACVAPAVLPQ